MILSKYKKEILRIVAKLVELQNTKCLSGNPKQDKTKQNKSTLFLDNGAIWNLMITT